MVQNNSVVSNETLAKHLTDVLETLNIKFIIIYDKKVNVYKTYLSEVLPYNNKYVLPQDCEIDNPIILNEILLSPQYGITSLSNKVAISADILRSIIEIRPKEKYGSSDFLIIPINSTNNDDIVNIYNEVCKTFISIYDIKYWERYLKSAILYSNSLFAKNKPTGQIITFCEKYKNIWEDLLDDIEFCIVSQDEKAGIIDILINNIYSLPDYYFQKDSDTAEKKLKVKINGIENTYNNADFVVCDENWKTDIPFRIPKNDISRNEILKTIAREIIDNCNSSIIHIYPHEIAYDIVKILGFPIIASNYVCTFIDMNLNIENCKTYKFIMYESDKEYGYIE